jgi:hypothetical protein
VGELEDKVRQAKQQDIEVAIVPRSNFEAASADDFAMFEDDDELRQYARRVLRPADNMVDMMRQAIVGTCLL